MKHQVTLQALTADTADIYRDIARIPFDYRGGIEEGTLCLLKCNGRKSYVAVRGSSKHTDATIKLDDKTRRDLLITEMDLKRGKKFLFTIKPISFPRRYWATCFASDPFNRITFQISLVSLVIGTIGFLLALPWASLINWFTCK